MVCSESMGSAGWKGMDWMIIDFKLAVYLDELRQGRREEGGRFEMYGLGIMMRGTFSCSDEFLSRKYKAHPTEIQ